MIIRWILLFLVGIPVQILMYLLYPVAVLLWRLFIFRSHPEKKIPPHVESVPFEPETRLDGLYINDDDDHGAFKQYGYVKSQGLNWLLDLEGNFLRQRNNDMTVNWKNVSGDVVVAWCFAAELAPFRDISAIKLAVDNYIKHLGTRSFDEINRGGVSARCNNVGVNYCRDAWGYIGQPAAGPQAYTSSALFALAYNISLKYKIIFWTHFVVFGLWYWAFFPIIYTTKNPLNYARDITMKSLYIHLQVFGPRWWIVKPMKFITYKISIYRNDLFYAMFGNPPPENFPTYSNAFFSQRDNCASDSDERPSRYIKPALIKIAKETRIKE